MNSEHRAELYVSWVNEVDEEWREELSAEELAEVERWDEIYETGVTKIAGDILEIGEKRHGKEV